MRGGILVWPERAEGGRDPFDKESENVRVPIIQSSVGQRNDGIKWYNIVGVWELDFISDWGER